MVKQSITYNDFSFGELSPNLFGRGNLNAYRNAAMKLLNFDVIQTGGIERRAGLKFIKELETVGKIIPFEYSSNKIFLLFFREKKIDIYDEDYNVVKTVNSPYTIADLPQIRWSQKGEQLYIVHPLIPPRILKYNSLSMTWSFVIMTYREHPEYGYTCQPYTRFDGTESVTLTPSDVTGYDIKITSNKTMFEQSHVGLLLLINGGEVLISEVISGKTAKAEVLVDLSSTDADANWQEQTFSPKRGYPSSVAFYQNRLVFGGTYGLKNRLWFSKIGEYNNFDLGTGLDDEAIEFDIFSEKVNQIVSVFSGRHLQVFTTDSEWMVTGNPITPSNIIVTQQTKIGSSFDTYIAPKFVEGSTVFVAKNGREIREFFYGDLTENYSSEDLILLSSHLLNKPKEQDYNVKTRKLYIVQDDGSLAVLLINKSHGINAWTQYKTEGKILSLAVVWNKVHVVVERGGTYCLEVFDDDYNLDCAKSFSFDEAVSNIQNMDFFNGKDVMVIADDEIYEIKVSNNEIVLPKPAKNIVVGFPFTHIFCPLPMFIGSSYIPKAVRLLELNLRIMNSKFLQMDVGAGPKNIEFEDENFSGDVKVRGRGFIKNYDVPLFKIYGTKPYKLKILNMSMLIDIIR